MRTRNHNGSKLLDRLSIKPGKKTMYKARKEEVISNFNGDVEKGASPEYLKSLYRYTKGEIAECNRGLGLHERDGLSRLNWSE